MKRLPRESLTPRMIQKAVWAGTRHSSFQTAAESMKELAGCPLSAKQVRRVTTRVGEDRVAERRQQVAAFTDQTLMQRTTAKPGVEPPEVGVVMLDNGMHQRRDHFGEPGKQTHWKQETGGLVLSMTSEVHAQDPSPEFPEWLFGSDAVREIASLAQRRETAETPKKTSLDEEDSPLEVDGQRGFAWTPRLLARDVIASTAGTDIARHLECVAWEQGITAAKRQAFVADGASFLWKIHRRYFSQMTGILDLMHALSYAYRAAAVLDEEGLYRRWAEAIWQGRVSDVLEELKSHQERLGPPPDDDASADDPRQRIGRAITYYSNHQSRMNYPEYRRLGLPITSSLMESAIKQLNQRVKGTEKYWSHGTAEAILQLRADSLSDSEPLKSFWPRWQQTITGMNRYRIGA